MNFKKTIAIALLLTLTSSQSWGADAPSRDTTKEKLDALNNGLKAAPSKPRKMEIYVALQPSGKPSEKQRKRHNDAIQTAYLAKWYNFGKQFNQNPWD